MSPFLQVLLSLFGAALLGNIIGWCARRIVAVRDEKMLIGQHRQETAKLQKELVAERDERYAERSTLEQKITQLELEADDNDRLNQTIEASEKEIAALRAESRSLQQEVAEKADKVRILEEKSQTQTQTAGQQAQQQAQQQHRQQPGQQRIAPGDFSAAQASPANAPQVQVDSVAARDVDLNRYALGSVASGAADLEVDDDIADLTSDLSSVLTPELKSELGSDAGVQAPSASGQTSGEGLFSRFNRKKKS